MHRIDIAKLLASASSLAVFSDKLVSAVNFECRGNLGAPQGLSYGQRQSEQMVNKSLSVAAKYIKFRGFVRLDELEVTGSPLVMFHPRSS